MFDSINATERLHCPTFYRVFTGGLYWVLLGFTGFLLGFIGLILIGLISNFDLELCCWVLLYLMAILLDLNEF